MIISKINKLLILCAFWQLSIMGVAQSKEQDSIGEVSDSLIMNLEECLDYAKENSITLQQYKLMVENNLADQLSAKGAFYPSLSASVGQSVNSNPLIETGAETKYVGSYGVDASIILYNGGKNRAALQQSKINGQISQLSYAVQENSIEVAITEIFVQILYATEQVEVAKQSLELSKKSLSRGEALLRVGSINQSDFALLESAKVSDEYAVVVAETAINNLYVSLKQLLEIFQDVTVLVKETELSTVNLLDSIPTVNDIYMSALEHRPEIKSSQLEIQSTSLGEKIAKSGYMPRLSLSAGVGVNHNSNNSFTFSNQLRNNFNTSAGLNLSIPILSKNVNKSSVAKARNYTKMAELDLIDAQKNLYQTIESLRNAASNAQAKFLVAEAKLQAIEKSLKLTNQQYELGMKNIIELLTEQNNYREASQEYITNKYQLLLNKALLTYYKTDQIKL